MRRTVLITLLSGLGMLAAPARAGGQQSVPPSKAEKSKTSVEACALLKASEIHAVPGDRVTDKKPSQRRSGSFVVAQCFYKTAHFSNSVSLAVATPDLSRPGRTGVREYWTERFHRDAEKTERSNEDPEKDEKESGAPRAIPGVGEEAFWVGNAINGALYVLRGGSFLRISVGGPSDESTKIKKTVTLAQHALTKLE